MLSSRQSGVRICRLQHGVVHHVVVVQRLLDEQQVELVQLAQRGRVGQGIGGVGIHLQEQRRASARAPRAPAPHPSPA